MMKKSSICRLVAAAALLLAPLGIANAQSDDDAPYEEAQYVDKPNARVLKVYPLQLGEAYLAYEKMHTERKSIEFGLSYIYNSYLKGDERMPDRKDVQGFGVQMSQRRYSSKNEGRPFGFFHGPVFGYRLLVFEENVFELPAQAPVGRLYQNSLDLSYQVGAQFRLPGNLTADVAASMGGRVKYAAANNAGELLTEHIIGHVVKAENNSAIFAVPLPQLKVSVGYAF